MLMPIPCFRCSIAIIVIGCLVLVVFPDGDFDTLTSKAFAKWRGLNNSWELLGRVDLELVRERPGQDRRFASVYSRRSTCTTIAYVDEAHA